MLQSLNFPENLIVNYGAAELKLLGKMLKQLSPLLVLAVGTRLEDFTVDGGGEARARMDEMMFLVHR